MRLILFDGYGTLFDRAMETLYETCQTVVDDLKLDMTREAFLNHWDGYFFPMIRAGEFMTFWNAHMIGLNRAFDDLDVTGDSEKYVSGLFEAFGRVPLYEDVKPALEALEGVKTGVVSNADHGHLTSALKTNGLVFEVVVSSESARCYKPNVYIFYDALKQFDCKAEDALYVGDSQEDDIVGARRAGLKIAWLNRDGAVRRDEIPEPDYEIENLAELPKLIGGIG
ncbi:MAG: HAD family hydrolase [Candidatus Latescibacteria bacterium]|nr:HAD family hydrolase [Candidatus Latescibacterota bacterium]